MRAGGSTANQAKNQEARYASLSTSLAAIDQTSEVASERLCCQSVAHAHHLRRHGFQRNHPRISSATTFIHLDLRGLPRLGVGIPRLPIRVGAVKQRCQSRCKRMLLHNRNTLTVELQCRNRPTDVTLSVWPQETLSCDCQRTST